MFIPGRYSTAAATAAAGAAVAPADNTNVGYTIETANELHELHTTRSPQEDQYFWHRSNCLQHKNGMNSVEQQQTFVQQPSMPMKSNNGAIPKQQAKVKALVQARRNTAVEADKMITSFPFVAAAGEGANGNSSHVLKAQTAWDISGEGGSNTPGAASLSCTYELEQREHHVNEEIDKSPQQLLPNIKDQNAFVTHPPSAEKPNCNGNLEENLLIMSTTQLYNTLLNYDALQDKYHTVLLLPKESKREVTAGGRDGSAYVLRCLKIWYELPSDVLFSAMSLVDRFLDRMAVKPKHMACMSVASFYLAIKQLNLKLIPADDLVTISQCGCTAGDLERMANVIASKLGVQMGQPPITSVSYLRIYYALFYHFAKNIGGQFYEFYKHLIKLEELENRLEILLCDVKTTVLTSSTLALVLICLHLDCHIKESYTRGSPELKHVFEYILFLQQYVKIPDRVFTCGFGTVAGILSHYNGQNKQPYKQRLVWKLSSRTLRVLRPMNRFSSDLPTIKEGIGNSADECSRFRSESISSEEEEDWPTSHIIAIFE